MKNQRATLLSFWAFAIILFAWLQPLSAAIIVDPNGTGANDVDPTNPITWNSSTTAYVGYTSSGELLVDSSSDIRSVSAYLGYSSGSNGKVTIDGTGSTKWNKSTWDNAFFSRWQFW